MNPFETCLTAHPAYLLEKRMRIEDFSKDIEFQHLSKQWRQMALQRKYMNNFSFLGRPLIQLPTDAIAIQEIIWAVKPDLVIETGIAHGGSLILSASVLELIGDGEVIGIDVEIRPHNRVEIERHSLSKRINLIEGSSVDPQVIRKISSIAKSKSKIVVLLDSNHTHSHVLAELNAYANLVSVGGYCVVFDTFIEDLPDDYIWIDRPWGKGNNPKTAVREWLFENNNFEIDKDFENRLMITSAPDGFLRRIK